jgi:hypothetical protein
MPLRFQRRGCVWRVRRVWRPFCLEVLVMRTPIVFGGSDDRIPARVCDDYVLIAARRGWTPMMFMTRVRL